jgi:hypothetical protein
MKKKNLAIKSLQIDLDEMQDHLDSLDTEKEVLFEMWDDTNRRYYLEMVKNKDLQAKLDEMIVHLKAIRNCITLEGACFRAGLALEKNDKT